MTSMEKALQAKTVDCTNFVRWLMDEVMDEENWEMNAVANGEIIYRKLKKLGLLDVVDGYYVETQETEWIPISERLPKKNEYVDDVCKYYLIQDEYGDMHVAHLSSRGWELMEFIKVLGSNVVAWMPLPEPYREDGEE